MARGFVVFSHSIIAGWIISRVQPLTRRHRGVPLQEITIAMDCGGTVLVSQIMIGMVKSAQLAATPHKLV